MSARLTDRDRALRAVLEADWQETVTRAATARGWFWYAPPRAGIARLGTVRGLVPGWPDLALARCERLVFAELKRETGKTTAEQDAWLARLAATGAETYVWRPSDLPEVLQVLA